MGIPTTQDHRQQLTNIRLGNILTLLRLTKISSVDLRITCFLADYSIGSYCRLRYTSISHSGVEGKGCC